MCLFIYIYIYILHNFYIKEFSKWWILRKLIWSVKGNTSMCHPKWTLYVSLWFLSSWNKWLPYETLLMLVPYLLIITDPLISPREISYYFSGMWMWRSPTEMCEIEKVKEILSFQLDAVILHNQWLTTASFQPISLPSHFIFWTAVHFWSTDGLSRLPANHFSSLAIMNHVKGSDNATECCGQVVAASLYSERSLVQILSQRLALLTEPFQQTCQLNQ